MQLFKDNYSKWTTLFFAAMTVFAIVFAYERFQADGAHYLLHVVQSENFRIEHQRYILAFSQLLPWCGVQVGAPMDAIIILNSLNPVLWWLLLFLYATLFLKDRHAAIGIILTHVLGVLHIQFVPMYEIWYGIPLVILLYSHLRNDRTTRVVDIVLFFAIFVTTLFAHPLLPIAVLFVFLYDAVEKKKLSMRVLIPAVILAGAWYVAKKMMLTEYESGKMAMMGADWNNAPQQLLHIGYYWRMFVYFMTWYSVPMLLFAWLIVFFLLRKMRLQLLVTCAFVLGHMLLIIITHEESYPDQSPYFERMYLPLVPVILIPFLFTLCRELVFSQSFIILSLLLVVGWRIGRFSDVGHDYKSRTQQVNTLIDQSQSLTGSKFVIADTDYSSCYKWADWSLPMETLIRSSACSTWKRVTIVTNEDLAENGNMDKLDSDEFLFRRWEIMKDAELNQRYFHLSAGKYQLLPPVCPE